MFLNDRATLICGLIIDPDDFVLIWGVGLNEKGLETIRDKRCLIPGGNENGDKRSVTGGGEALG